MDIELNGLDEFLVDVRNSPDRLMGELVRKANKHAETLAGLVRDRTPLGEVAGGRTKQSIQGFVEVDKDTVTGGARSDYPNAVYQEFGTGPVAEAAGYPGEVQGGPITHVTEGWFWPSGEQGQNIKAQRHGAKENNDGKEKSPEDYNIFTYTEGQPPKAMFHNAMEAYGDKIAEDFGETILEVFKE